MKKYIKSETEVVFTPGGVTPAGDEYSNKHNIYLKN